MRSLPISYIHILIDLLRLTVPLWRCQRRRARGAGGTIPPSAIYSDWYILLRVMSDMTQDAVAVSLRLHALAWSAQLHCPEVDPEFEAIVALRGVVAVLAPRRKARVRRRQGGGAPCSFHRVHRRRASKSCASCRAPRHSALCLSTCTAAMRLVIHLDRGPWVWLGNVCCAACARGGGPAVHDLGHAALKVDQVVPVARGCGHSSIDPPGHVHHASTHTDCGGACAREHTTDGLGSAARHARGCHARAAHHPLQVSLGEARRSVHAPTHQAPDSERAATGDAAHDTLCTAVHAQGHALRSADNASRHVRRRAQAINALAHAVEDGRGTAEGSARHARGARLHPLRHVSPSTVYPSGQLSRRA
mmetsp:Transcript_5218/g.14309  ORF Transcript_5218/g.14309 Transcript_5218/m.14309 type:complete len:362 (+) Transcript_5218:1591-2676(+)